MLTMPTGLKLLRARLILSNDQSEPESTSWAKLLGNNMSCTAEHKRVLVGTLRLANASLWHQSMSLPHGSVGVHR